MKNMRICGRAAQIMTCSAAFVGALSLHADASANEGTNGQKIMGKVALTRKLDGSESVITITILNAKGKKREGKIAVATKLYDDGKTEKRIYRILSPAELKGIGVLIFDYEDKNDEMWIYLPELRKTRRISSIKKSKNFLGSEFSYADLNIPTLSNFTYRVVREESVDGAPCWVIETLPKNDKVAESEGYSKKLYWVSKAEHTVRRAVFYDLEGELLKELTSKDIKLLDPKKQRYRPMYMEMVNKQNGRRSVFKSEKVLFSPETKDSFFTTRYLERGTSRQER
jgi:hypothetical protein